MSPANDNLGMNDRALFCAVCGAADVTSSGLAGGEAGCNVCGWKGRVEELAALPFQHDMGSTDEVYRRFFLDLRKLLSTGFATDVGKVLIKWGFMEEPTAKNMKQVQQHLARYIAGIAKALATSIVQTRAEIEKENHSARPTA